MSPAKPSFLEPRALPQLLLFGGKGGVGKTTCAAATALRLARASPEARFLLVSTDPAHSLADSLAGVTPPPNLQITELDAQECLATFKRQHGAKLREIASRGTFLDHDDINNFLELSLPGLDELMATLEITRWVEAGTHQCIVVDTAPTGHTLRLLAMPALLRQWLDALNALLAKHRYLKQLYRSSAPPDDIDRFLLDLDASVQRLEALLRDPARCRFVPVLLAEELSFRETCALLVELERLRLLVTDMVINRLYPDNPCPVCADARARQATVLRRILDNRAFSRCALWTVPLYALEVRGTEVLQGFCEGTTKLVEAPAPPQTPLSPAAPRVEAAAAPPPRETTLLLFAGKGGVGKTTLACATSLWLAQAFPGTQVLLFSTDPAHSLSACLDGPVGPRPRQLCRGLTVLEIDAEAEFNALKQLYALELESFLESLLPDVDLAFDREAMEKILDLAPPGLDEVMGLTQVMELLESGRYQTLVLDAAPTGHLIRLLELPELINQWLKAFFGLFLRYHQLFRLPRVSQRLVEMSKHLNHLRALLADPARCGLYAVSILTDMAFAETKDLLAACDRMRLQVPVLFLNLATPPSRCPLCAALHRRESVVRQQFAQAFPNAHQVLVYRQGEPRGLARLQALAQALYETPTRMEAHYA
ncbi:MAG: TRC40/GET3/ArsA family transport-energizing ATPase [Verrucomicrobia bacterium]|nr:TRC40/GET3/ArsA family transport-energizing ATPase [Verrucomicrobiota bacterium]